MPTARPVEVGLEDRPLAAVLPRDAGLRLQQAAAIPDHVRRQAAISAVTESIKAQYPELFVKEK